MVNANMAGKVVVVGGGPVGCVLATLLARRGHDVEVFEKRPDMRAESVSAGRSINLVLTNRGLRALGMLGLRRQVLELTVPVLGRMMHAIDGELAYQPYGKDDSECNYSVSRGELNAFLLDAVEAQGVPIHFGHAVTDVDFEAGRLSLTGPSGEQKNVSASVIFGADGAPSAVRRALAAQGHVEDSITWLSHAYKELTFPARDTDDALAGHALHIWPRGHHMLMALANCDGSFTGTIYLPREGDDSFDRLDSAAHVRAFFEAHYPDAIPLSPDFDAAIADHPQGTLGTVRCHPWRLGARALLIGDAAHGIVPFFGQGLNCGFEDCAVLDDVLAQTDDLARAFSIFDARRKPNADAIATMALENFIEMRDRVGDEAFLRRKRLERAIEQRLSDRYRSRYAMVMYSSIPYQTAYEAGKLQDAILDELLANPAVPEVIDWPHCERLIAERLTPYYKSRDVDLAF